MKTCTSFSASCRVMFRLLTGYNSDWKYRDKKGEGVRVCVCVCGVTVPAGLTGVGVALLLTQRAAAAGRTLTGHARLASLPARPLGTHTAWVAARQDAFLAWQPGAQLLQLAIDANVMDAAIEGYALSSSTQAGGADRRGHAWEKQIIQKLHLIKFLVNSKCLYLCEICWS